MSRGVNGQAGHKREGREMFWTSRKRYGSASDEKIKRIAPRKEVDDVKGKKKRGRDEGGNGRGRNNSALPRAA